MFKNYYFFLETAYKSSFINYVNELYKSTTTLVMNLIK